MKPSKRLRPFAGRPLISVGRAIVNGANYASIFRLFTRCQAPVDFLRRYVAGSGEYPYTVRIDTPTGQIAATAHCGDDIRTINEIFFRGDYGTECRYGVVVDFGSNIGISVLFFLSRNQHCFVYCHEPLQQNTERLKDNLQPFAGRYELREAAVTQADGTVLFGCEPTGRYGGVGKVELETITVKSLDSNRVLREIIDRHGRIDLLKIDIETLEYELTARITPDLAEHIGQIVIELEFDRNPLAATHDMTYRKPITTLRRRSG